MDDVSALSKLLREVAAHPSGGKIRRPHVNLEDVGVLCMGTGYLEGGETPWTDQDTWQKRV